MLGQLYERALGGEGCWIRDARGGVSDLPVAQWLGGHGADEPFDTAVIAMCDGPTIELGCGPARLVAGLVRRGVPALGVDQSATAVRLARRRGTPVLHGDVFGPLPGVGQWATVLLADGTVGLGGDPQRLLSVAAQLLRRGGRCLVEVDPRYFRPTEVELLLGDPTKAQEQLGWKHETSPRDLAREMVQADMEVMKAEPIAGFD